MKETEQIKFWKGEFGDEYTSRNEGDIDELYQKQFGISRTELNNEFLNGINKDITMLEVGCNRCLQLNLLEKMGFNNLWGVEINKKALSVSKNNKALNLVEGSAFDIPFKDKFFDLVFTSGVLIHISPEDLPKVIDEMYRTAKKYIWCFEYFSEECKEISYRGNENKLWKNNFLKLFLERHPDLRVVKQKNVRYLEDGNVDEMFLLEKVT
jgi:pseudaminic acid biosynthesis-associated methylase